MNYFIGVDVGTGSARAALVTDKGKIVKIAVREIKTWNNADVFYEQSSDDIWRACVLCVREVATVAPQSIKGIGFAATCSLVAVDEMGRPLTVSLSKENERNVILWLDHRASLEAKTIISLKHKVLSYIGGQISLEMETPKLLWLKNNLKDECWDKAGSFFDLPDFLTWKATSCESRSLCSLVCKWTYEINEVGNMGWNKSYFEEINLQDLLKNNSKKIGNVVKPPGSPVGNGLSSSAAQELGLLPNTPVGTSIIDAHAGGLGLIGCSVNGIDPEFHTRLGLICGTSTCHMAVSKNPTFCKGIWGPYYSAMVPDMWLNEGGQSVTGKLIDFMIETHPATKEIKEKIDSKMHIQEYLNELLIDAAKRQGYEYIDFLTKDLHVWPDFHGNRSPIADPNLKGAICGLSLSASEENLALIYLATIQALAYGTRHILESLQASGYESIKSILICGGLSKNRLFTQTQADVVSLPVICPNESESVLLGASMLGACAANYFTDMRTALTSMGGEGISRKPNPVVKNYHDKKFVVFLKMLEHQNLYRNIMG